MGNPYVGNASTFLIEVVFGLYLVIVMLRFLLQLMRADFYNPLSQFIVRATQPPLKVLRRFVPPAGKVDTSSLVLLLAVQAVEVVLIVWFGGRGTVVVGGVALMTVAELLQLAINVFLFSILVSVVISWVNPGLHSPVTSILHSLNEPLLAPARRLIPPIAGLDLSPIAVLVGLQLISMLLVRPIYDAAAVMMFSPFA